MSFFADQGEKPMFNELELDRVDEIEVEEY